MAKIRFYSSSLQSKWGFEDGDILSNLVNDSIPYIKTHDLLKAVVKKFLIPKLNINPTIEEYITIHNPIRIEETEIKLTPEYIEVDEEEIIELAKEL